MVFTDDGKSGLALAFTGSMDLPSFTGIGSGSGAALVTRSGLIAQVGSKTFTSADISTVNEVTYVSDFGAVGMSGVNLREFGVFAGSLSMFSIEGFDPVTFDGTNELQLQVTFEVF